MSATPAPPGSSVFAVRLLPADPQQPAHLAGRIEHVLSGRRHDFANGPALLACLALEQQQTELDRLALAAKP